MSEDVRERLHRTIDGLSDGQIRDASWLLVALVEAGSTLAGAQDRRTRWFLLLSKLVATAPPAWVEDDRRRVRLATSLPYASSEAFNQEPQEGRRG
ncbi:MAG: hypothetical protein M3O34_13000 [Chloroflexota bacterium]|nr:hypothetical protein [Chloroflexota bacterium]